MSKIFPVWSSRIWGTHCPLFLFPSKCRFLRHLGRSCLQTKQAKKNTHTCIHTLLYKMYNFALFSTLPTLPQLIYILIIIFFHVSTVALCLWVIMNEYLTILPVFAAQQRLNSIELADCFLIFCLDGLFFCPVVSKILYES